MYSVKSFCNPLSPEWPPPPPSPACRPSCTSLCSSSPRVRCRPSWKMNGNECRPNSYKSKWQVVDHSSHKQISLWFCSSIHIHLSFEFVTSFLPHTGFATSCCTSKSRVTELWFAACSVSPLFASRSSWVRSRQLPVCCHANVSL